MTPKLRQVTSLRQVRLRFRQAAAIMLRFDCMRSGGKIRDIPTVRCVLFDVIRMSTRCEPGQTQRPKISITIGARKRMFA